MHTGFAKLSSGIITFVIPIRLRLYGWGSSHNCLLTTAFHAKAALATCDH